MHKLVFSILFSLFSLFGISQTNNFETILRFGPDTWLNSISETKNGDFMLLGSKFTFSWEAPSTIDLIITKVKKNGDFSSNSTKILSDDSLNYNAVEIIRTKDGNQVILLCVNNWHNSDGHVSLIGIDDNDSIIWTNYISKYSFLPYSISEDENSNLKILGTSDNTMSYIITDNRGNLISNKFDLYSSINKYTTLGTINVNNLTKIDIKCNYSKSKLLVENISNNDTLWSIALDSINCNYTSFIQTDNSSFLVLTKDTRYSKSSGLRLLNIDFSGSIKLDTFYFKGFNQPLPSKIYMTNDNNYIFYTTTRNKSQNDLMLVKFTSTGKIIWTTSTIGSAEYNDTGKDFKVLDNGYILLTKIDGDTPYGSQFSCIYRFNEDGNISPLNKRIYNFYDTHPTAITSNIDGLNKSGYFQIFPNPVYNKLIISNNQTSTAYYEILDLNGKLQMKGIIDGNDINIDVNTIHSGVYIIRFTSKNINEVQKFIKVN